MLQVISFFVGNRREIQLTRLALPYDYTCFADGYSIWIRNICLMYNYRVYNITPLSEMNENKSEIFLVNVFPPNERSVIRMRICIIFSVHPFPYSLIHLYSLIPPSPFLLILPSLYPLIRTSNFLFNNLAHWSNTLSKEILWFDQPKWPKTVQSI